VNPFWKVKDEGYLRIYTENDDKYWDVSPILDKLVVFRSSDVPHEVMPTYAERFAITVWYYSPTKTKAVTGNKLPVLESKQILYQVPDKRHLDEQAASIFVSIPSYRDSECEHTIKNLFMTARNPDRIFVGLCLQYIEGVDNVSFFQNKDFKYSNQIRICWMKARDAKGPCLARSNAQKLYAGEEFYLQIDSHMRFREHWDTFLINELAKCTPQKSIITSYPLGYTLPNMVSEDIRPTLLCAKQFDSDGMLRLVARILKAHTKKPLSSSFWAAGFAFSRADVIEEVPYDPTLNFLFFGEEMIMSARLWTNGWNFFAPTETIVYHLWSRDYRPVYHEVMDDENLRLDALRSVQSRLGLIEEPHIGIKNSYELGKERSLDDFQKAIGIDFKSQTIEWRAEWANFDPILFDLTASFEQ
jgi:[Skp1-protein]-hydroxyproline N-acetylglucosaminyltransferase